MSRYIKLAVITIGMLFIFTGCHMEEKIGEKVTENVLEDASGDDVDVDVKGDDISISSDKGKMTIKDDKLNYEGENGEKIVAGGDNKWPKDQAAIYLPELSKGKITYILNSDTSCMMTIEELDADVYKDYVKEIQNKGYTKNKVESTSDEATIYAGESEDGIAVTASYYNSDKTLQLTVDASGKQAK